MSDVYHALSSPARRDILGLLKSGDMSAGEIAEKLNITKSTLSGHFNVLKAAKLVVTERSGTTIIYSLNTSVVEDMLGSLIALFSDKNKTEEKNNDSA